MAKTRKSLWAAGFALLVCILLLLGTTFAWFTDSVSNRGNKIQAGNLSIEATAYDLDNEATPGTGYTIEGVNNGSPLRFESQGTDIETMETGIINETLWEPGKSSAKLLKVKNVGTLAAKIKVDFDIVDDGLTEALWFDFIQVGADGNIRGQFTERSMSTLETFADSLELQLLETDENVQFILVYGMDEEAGNEYQGETFEANVTILATQEEHETDGFGNPDYDKNATYDAINQEELSIALEQGGSVSIGSDMTFAESTTISGDTQTTLNLRDNSEVMFTGAGIIDLNDNAQLTINGEGSLNQNMESEVGYLIRANGNSRVVIESGTFISGLTCVQAGDNAQVEIYGGHFGALTTWSDRYWLLNLIDNSNASITVYGGTFVNFDPSHSDTENPQENFVADGYKVVTEQHGKDIWYTVVPE